MNDRDEGGWRKHVLPGGRIELVRVPWCRCTRTERRGPLGGVCGACGGAIPKTGWFVSDRI